MPQSYKLFLNLPNIFEAKLQTQEMGLPFMLKETESRAPESSFLQQAVQED